MNLSFYIIFLMILIIICYQDLIEREVTLFLLLFGIAIGGYLHYINTVFNVFLFQIGVNISLILFIGGVLFIYSKFKLQKKLFSTIGLGDFLFFFVLGISFPTYSFLILFSTSLIFSLTLFLLLKPHLKHKTVPLAGFQALFLSIILVINLFFNFVNLYAY